jgi:hypothetical protein
MERERENENEGEMKRERESIAEKGCGVACKFDCWSNSKGAQ